MISTMISTMIPTMQRIRRAIPTLWRCLPALAVLLLAGPRTICADAAFVAAAASLSVLSQEEEQKGGEEGKDGSESDTPKEKDADGEDAKKKEEKTIAIVGGTVYPVSGPVLHRGTVIIRGDKIHSVGVELTVPEGAEVVDATGKHVAPGFVSIDASRIAVSGRGSDMAASLDPYDFDLRLALAHGITTANVSSGASFVRFSSRSSRASSPSIVIKLTYGDLAGMVLREKGLNALSIPSRQIELNLFNMRDGFRQATEHLAAVEEAKKKNGKPPRPAAQIVAYVTILQNEQPTVVDATTAEEIRDILALRDAYPFDLVISGPVEGASMAKELAARRVPVILQVRGPDFSFDFSTPVIDEEGLIPIRLPSAFAGAGCEVAIRTRTSGVSLMGLAGRDLTALPLEAAFAVRGGLSEADALAAITLRPAKILRLGDRVGSLEAGKDADVLILNRDPLDYRTFVLKAFVNGKVYYEREKSRLFRDVPLR